MSDTIEKVNPDVDLEQLATNPNDPQKADDFFDQLDKQVMGSALSEPSAETSVANNQTVETPTQDSPEVGDYANLEKRYSDSSREAQRLNTRLKELEPYLPILEEMKEDPNLVSHVRGYFEGGGSAPQDLKSKLGLDEEFMFDYDDAVSDPKSDSGRLFQATVDGVVQRRISEFADGQAKQNAQKADEKIFRENFNIGDEDYTDLVNYAKSKKLTLEDVYYLKNRTSRDQKVAENVQQSNINQMKNARQGTPQSIASVGNEVRVESSLDDQVFDQLLGVGERLNDIGL